MTLAVKPTRMDGFDLRESTKQSKDDRYARRGDAARFRNPDHDPRGPYLLIDATTRAERPSLRYELRGFTPPADRAWRFSLERLTQLAEEDRLVFGAGGFPRIKRYLSEVQAPEPPTDAKGLLHAPQDASALSVAFIVKRAMAELIRAVARAPEQLAKVEWRDLERALGEAFERLGFDARVTRPARDGGFDIELTCTNDGRLHRYLVEVKHWMGSGQQPSHGIIAAFFDVVAHDAGVDRGLLLSTTGFSAPTAARRTRIERQKIALGSQDKVIAICQEFVQREDGLLIPDPDELPEMLFAGTL